MKFKDVSNCDFQGIIASFIREFETQLAQYDRVVYFECDEVDNSVDCKMHDTPCQVDIIGHITVYWGDMMKLHFTNKEIWALFAHEIGHLVNNAISPYPDIRKEYVADDMACQLGLKEQMVFALSKMMNSNYYSVEQKNGMENRINRLMKPKSSS